MPGSINVSSFYEVATCTDFHSCAMSIRLTIANSDKLMLCLTEKML